MAWAVEEITSLGGVEIEENTWNHFLLHVRMSISAGFTGSSLEDVASG